MTCIVADGDVIAWESCVDVGGSRAIYPRHKVTYIGGRLYAIAGEGPDAVWFAKWFTKGCPQDSIPPGTWTLLVVEKDTTLRLLSTEAAFPDEVAYPFAIGSGADKAMGAIVVGADAVRACAAACKLDIACSGPVYAINIVEALKGPWRGKRLPVESDVDEVLGEIRGRK